MSIRTHLDGLVAKGDLVPFQVRHPLRNVRALYLTPAVLKELNDAKSAVNHHGVRADCIRVMERWVSGGNIPVSMSGSGRGAILARLDPPPADIWELRITEPNVQFRAFGQFVAKDVLIVTALQPRGTLLTKKLRSRRTRSATWTAAMYGCFDVCKKLIAPYLSLSGSDPATFVSENYDVL